MDFFERITKIDRRIIFIIIFLAIILPLLFRVDLPITVTPEVQKVYDLVDSLPPGSVIVMPCEYAPDTMAELEPMLYAVLRHCFRKDIKVIGCLFFPTGVTLIENEFNFIAEEMGKTYGEDYIFLGYRPYPAVVIMSMGQDFRQSFPTDYYGNPLDSLSMMQGVRNYNDTELVLTINATSGVDFWIIYGRERYGFPFAIGVTAVMAADYYSYLNSGQVLGIIGGLKGAAEYETLIDHEGLAVMGMSIQSFAHIVIVAFIIIGNLGYFMSRKRKRGL
ncbi:MAG: hypothetical protein GY855_00830 [candidate division Zixibacteria bacterium]|nr:hypothetical protein [candidate division Zixibacteria bacterium]